MVNESKGQSSAMKSVDKSGKWKALEQITTSDIYQLLAKLESVPAQLAKLTESVQFVSDSFDDLKAELMLCKKELDSSKKEITRLSRENQFLNRDLSKLKDLMEENEQKSLSHIAEIHGFPDIPNENIISVVHALGEELQLPTTDIVVTRKTYAKAADGAEGETKKRKGPPPILVKFPNVTACQVWLDKRKTGLEVKNFFEGGSDDAIYINDHLTQYNRNIFWNARVQGKNLNFKYVWVKYGAVYMKKDEKSKAIRIKRVEDIPTFNPRLSTKPTLDNVQSSA